MARLFNVEVFNKTINGAVASPPYTTSADFYSLLGSADSLTVQLVVDAVSVDGTEVTATYYVANGTEEEMWNVAQKGADPMKVAVTSDIDLPTKSKLLFINPSDDFVNGAFGRFLILSTAPGAAVRLIVCGRSH